MAQPRRTRATARDPYSTKHSSNSGRRLPHANKVDRDDPNRTDILITLHRFELAGIDIDDKAVEIATKLTRWHIANADRRDEEQAAELAARIAAAQARDCWVYYIRCGRLIKIGMTTNLSTRFASIRPNEVLAIEPGGLEREADMHQRFAGLRAGGEYFHPGAALQEHIKELREELGVPNWTASTVQDGGNWFPDDSPASFAT